jgi:SAM-dependent methyltransferase
MESQPDISAMPPVSGRAEFETLRAAARHHYGADANGYQAGRPGYPPQVYTLLRDRCGVRSGSRILEIGAGTGQVTLQLLAAGAQVVAVEPDPGFAGYLRRHLPQVQVVPRPFEEAEVGDGFDAVVAATSFHWLDQPVALAKVRAALRPGGWAAIWWTIFSDPYREDPLLDAATARLGFEPGNQRAGTGFQRDAHARQSDLRDLAGLSEVSAEQIPWDLAMDAVRTRELFDSMITIRQLPDADRAHVLDTLTTLVEEQFGGVARRPMLTVLYLGRRSTSRR